MSSGPASFLDMLVDNEFVLAVYLVRFEEGIVAYWPKEHFDSEAVEIADALSVPLRPGLYIIVGGDKLMYSYVGLVVGKGVLIFRMGEGVPLEKFAEKISRTYFIFVENSLKSKSRNVGEKMSNGIKRLSYR
ncbi:MAG: hypothetical protein QW604_02520 [Fervidicoccaceae archaeon]|jgi:hypothetical protein|nr:hypothetical protein [Fervidicoccaceae archaeon]